MEATTTSLEDITTQVEEQKEGINWWGLVSVIVFYIAILVIGLYASWKKKSLESTNSDDVFLAGRDIGLFVGMFTMTATWVGGGYINGTAEMVYIPGGGLVWAQAPIGYSISLCLAGFLFAKKMREAGYVTMLDPFDQRYGQVMAGFLYIPALLGEVFWSGAILSALGASLAVILHMGHDTAIIISAGVAVFYTVIGGLYSVAYTDVIQLICIFVGLWLAVIFALINDVVEPIGSTMTENPSWWTADNTTWLGELDDRMYGYYVDCYLLLMFGGIPWQVYFQRVLSSRTAGTAKFLSFTASIGCILMSIPAVLIGCIARSADWTKTEYRVDGKVVSEIPKEQYALVLPLVMQYLTPTVVAVLGLGAVSAAVMSSADSSILSAASMFARNVYKPFRNVIYKKTKASEKEIIWAMRVGVIACGAIATYIAIVVDSIYGLWFFCSDLVYVILFPQLVCVVYLPKANTYGSITGYILGLIFRFTGGEGLLNLPPVIKYPGYIEDHGIQNFPFKTMSMLISMSSIVLVSHLTHWLFTSKTISSKWDVLQCVGNGDGCIEPMQEKPPQNGTDMEGSQNTAYKSSTTQL